MCNRSHNWPLVGFHGTHRGIQLLIFTIVGGLYGGLYLLAWNAFFANPWLKLIWRLSGLLIASSGPIYLAYSVVDPVYAIMDKLEFNAELGLTRRWISGWLVYLIICIPMRVLMLAGGYYIPASIFLIVDCCLQLSRLPPSAYDLPQWSQYWSHIN